MTRSTSYYATVRMLNGKVDPRDEPILDGIKIVVKMNNEAFDTANRKYVKLQGRGPRSVPSEARYGKGRRRGFDQSLPLSLAKTADVYVYDR